LELLPVDMAKIGQLYLNDGHWLGEQVLASTWVRDATRVHSTPSPEMGYGYQWWIRPQGDYYSLGWGGQQIRVFPKEDMVVVFTAGMSGADILHDDLVDQFLLPAIKSKESLPVNSNALARLETAVQGLSTPQVGRFNSLPAMARNVDGKQWLVTGRGDWNMFRLHFSNEKEAQLELTLDDDLGTLAVGLDGVYRVTDTKEHGAIALYGYWESPDTFVLVQQNLQDADRRITRLKFLGDTVKLFSQWFVEPYEEESEGVLFSH
jgi:hypothetical protein